MLVFALFLLFCGCSEVKIIDTIEYSEESEPNDQSFSADEISAGKFTGHTFQPLLIIIQIKIFSKSGVRQGHSSQ
jgi:hypothetical protein